MIQTPHQTNISFDGLGIAPKVLEILDRMRFKVPTPIQHKAIPIAIEGKDVIWVEDIVDTGLTLDYLIKNFITRNPNSIKICTFLDKKEARKPDTNIIIDYFGYEVPNQFLVGYGLDFAEKYRNLPFIAAITD